MIFKDTQFFAFMDYETTGVDTSRGTKVRPIQIGIVFTDNEFTKIVEYDSLIKWDSLMQFEDWPKEFYGAYKVHDIPLWRVRERGLWPYQIRQDINTLVNDVVKPTDPHRKPVIISDAPNFEMFWTEMIYGSRAKAPFHYNAWSVYPVLHLFGVYMDRKPHDALDDARLMYKAMVEVYEMAKERE